MNTLGANRPPSPRRAAQKFKENISKRKTSPSKKTVILSMQRKVKVYEFKQSYLRQHINEPYPLSTRAYQAELTSFLHAYDKAITADVVTRWVKAHLWITVPEINGGMEECVVQLSQVPTTRAQPVVDTGVVYPSRRATPINDYNGPEEPNINRAAHLRDQPRTITIDARHIRGAAPQHVFRAIQDHDQTSSSSCYTIRSETSIPTPNYVRGNAPTPFHPPVTSSGYSRQGQPIHVPVNRYHFSPPIARPQILFGHPSANNIYQPYDQPQRFYEPMNNPPIIEVERNGNSVFRQFYPGGSPHLHNGHNHPSANMHYDDPFTDHYQHSNELPPHFPQMRRPPAYLTATEGHYGANFDDGYTGNNMNPILSSDVQLSASIRDMKRIMSSVILNPRESIGNETIVDKHTRIMYTIQCMIQLCNKMPTLKRYVEHLERCVKIFTRQVSKELAPVSHLEAFRRQYPVQTIAKAERNQSDDDSSILSYDMYE